MDEVRTNVSAEVPDWSREKPRQFWDPGRKLLLAIRRYQYWRARAGLFARGFRKLMIMRIVSGAQCPWCTRTRKTKIT